MTPLTYARAARTDLEDIIAYISLDNPPAAEKTYRRITETVNRLADFPALGRPGRWPETSEISVPGLPYVIVYETSAEAITVLAVLHGARDLAHVLAERRNEKPRQ